MVTQIKVLLTVLLVCSSSRICRAQDARSHFSSKPHAGTQRLQIAPQDSSLEKSKPSLAPVIAFGLVGFFVGGSVGALIDGNSPQSGGENVGLNVHFTTGIVAGIAIGTVGGAYLGYRLSKKDLKRKKKRRNSK